MAELIPAHYRVRLLVHLRMRRWIMGGVLVAALCAASLMACGAWAHAATGAIANLQNQYRGQASLLQRSQDLQSRRNDLAERMKKIEGLKNDKTLLALLHNLSEGKGDFDCLEYLHIDARGTAGKDTATIAASASDSDSSHFTVRLSGITNTPGTLADFMTRLGKAQQPTMQVQLETSKRENYLDGQVIRFQMSCQQGEKKGT